MDWRNPDYEEVFWQRRQALELLRKQVDEETAAGATRTTLDDLKGKRQADPRVVLAAIMKAGGQFSVFDATANQMRARSIDFIERNSGWVERIPEKSAYPWVTLRLTPKGIEAMAGLT